jgi:hypothetical protein
MKATDPSDFGAATILVPLPVPGPGGKPLIVEIEAATPEELIPLMKGIAGMGGEKLEPGDDPLGVTLEWVATYGEKSQPLIERFVKSPAISFNGPKPGAVQWISLHMMNRLALVNAISEFSQNGSVRRAEQLASFPHERGGGADGAPARVAREAAKAPA